MRTYGKAIDAAGAERVVAVLTSAVRDAQNGADLERALRERFGFEAMTITGEREARLTFLGATSARPPRDVPLMVLDIGGGSTEIVVGSKDRVEFFVSTQVGSVRYTERFLHTDPPTASELDACRDGGARRARLRRARGRARSAPREGIAVAGTPTSFAAIDLALEPYDRDRVDGHRLTLGALRADPRDWRAGPSRSGARVRGLHPDRAPTIVAGGIILVEAMGCSD